MLRFLGQQTLGRRLLLLGRARRSGSLRPVSLGGLRRPVGLRYGSCVRPTSPRGASSAGTGARSREGPSWSSAILWMPTSTFSKSTTRRSYGWWTFSRRWSRLAWSRSSLLLPPQVVQRLAPLGELALRLRSSGASKDSMICLRVSRFLLDVDFVWGSGVGYVLEVFESDRSTCTLESVAAVKIFPCCIVLGRS